MADVVCTTEGHGQQPGHISTRRSIRIPNMGWFSKEKQEGYQPNNRSSRKLCWEARDAYFQCLDSVNVVNALDPQQEQNIKKNCAKQDQNFNENCATSWIKYFKEKRVVDHRKEQFMKTVEKENAQIIELTPDQMTGRSN